MTVMYILDTDHLSLIRRNGIEGQRILVRLSSISNNDVATTIVTYEEQVRGRFAVLGRAKTLDEVVLAYDGLRQLALDYQSISILAFDAEAALASKVTQTLPASRKHGSKDCSDSTHTTSNTINTKFF
jgi:tRNA(fMet)-specific endonuclease VapC